MKHKVIIIGAGVAGLATAIALAREGYKVSIFEKNPEAGGRCGVMRRDGHRFDLGATIFLMPGIYREVFDYLGLSLDKDLPGTALPDIYRLFYNEKDFLDFSTNEAYFKQQLEKFEAGSFERAQQYLATGYKMYLLALKHLLGRNFYRLFEFVNLKNLRLLAKLKIHLNHQSYTARFFEHPYLKTAFTFQNIYVGQNPLKAPALFSMLPAAELNEGSLFPIGGMHRIVEVLQEKALNLGVDIHCNCEVQSILTGKNCAKGVLLEDQSIHEADIVVANADLPYVYKELLPSSRKSKQLERKSYSCSAIVFHWGLDKQYSQLGHHNVLLSTDYKKGLEAIFKHNSMSSEPSFYVHAPAQTDPTAAPRGQESMTVIIPVGHLDDSNRDCWQQLKQNGRNYVIDRLKKQGLTDIEQHIKFEICFLPPTWQSVLNVCKGSVFGSINHNILQMGYFRPHNKHTRYKNLYFAGGSTHPGNGVPLVLLSAKLCSLRILNDFK
ncbi:MAG: phytoene desaturase family protein [Bacteroidales bacterium]|nr:phytoene desaturase family protein [Bacteroidales bacterium]MDD3430940.1 phytoene desaturase family protein [Bacteroidales bacterium]MDD4361842.1 phytoene desaturase family protein [Bacteroidales bacterium]MDD4429918.1 phytoene desaturase family protein [Bacteroidales bacterium]